MNASTHPEPSRGPKLAGPLYSQIEMLMRERVLASEWRQGQPLPTEIELAREYNVSVGTMRKSLDLLAHSRLIVRKQGLGTFVTDGSARGDGAATSWVMEGKTAREAFVRVLHTSVDAATAGESQALDIASDGRITRLSLLSSIDDRGRVIDEYVLKSHLIGASDDFLIDPESVVNGVLPQIERLIGRLIDSIAVVRASVENAQRLGVEVGMPLLSIQRLAYDREGHPMFVVTRTAHLDRGRYKVEMLGG